MRVELAAGHLKMRRRLAILGVLAVLAALALAYATGRGGTTRSGRIVVADTVCAPGWVAPHSGRTVFTVVNTSTVSTYDVELAGADHFSDFGQIERLAPGTTDTMDVVLPPGTYSFECGAFGGGVLDSAPAVVTGPPVANAKSFAPVTSDQMQLATLAYRTSLKPWLRRLQEDADTLARTGAKRAWLATQLDYARLGAAYDAFGAYGSAVEGAFAANDKLALDRSVRALVLAFPKLPMGNGDVALRTHEILENTLQFELAGRDDHGLSLAIAWANVQGTELALRAIAPLLTISSPAQLAQARIGLARLGALFGSYRRPDGSWRTLASLSRVERERIDAATSGLLEQLAPIPDRLEIVERRGTNGRDPS
jgi:hypothetical protein